MTKVVLKGINMVLVFATFGLIGMACQQALPVDNTADKKAEQEAAQAAEMEKEKRKRQRDLAKARFSFMDECWALGGWPQGGLLAKKEMTVEDRQAGITCSFDHRLTHNLINGIESTKRFTHADRQQATERFCGVKVAILPRRISPITGYCYVVVK